MTAKGPDGGDSPAALTAWLIRRKVPFEIAEDAAQDRRC